MSWVKVQPPKKKTDYRYKFLRILAAPPPSSFDYRNNIPDPALPVQIGDVARVYMRRALKDMTVYIPEEYRDLYSERVLELHWKCPHCSHEHPVFIPEGWIAEGKAEFVEAVEDHG